MTEGSPVVVGGAGQRVKWTAKGQEKFGADYVNVWYHDCGGGFTITCTFPHSLHLCILSGCGLTLYKSFLGSSVKLIRNK